MDTAVSSQKSGDNSATRRNTRSTSNQERDKNQEIPESSKSNSSNSSTKDRDTTNMEPTKKKACDRVERGSNGDVLSYTTEDDITYRISDSAYLETERPDAPYSICIIQEIKVSKRDSAIVYVKWYYRPTEVPDLVYQMLIKNRYNQVGDSEVKNLIMNQDVINRELFLDERVEATDSFSIGNLKGKCQVSHYTDVSEMKNFELKPDHFFYICSYSPENRRLASSKGETRVGPSHQWSARMRGMFQKAVLPDLLHQSEHGYDDGRVYEEMTWQPNVDACDLIMCLRAARSLAAFAGVCDGVLPEEGCIAACRDDTTINALRVLYENNGNPRKAIDDLVKNPVPVTIDSKWTEDQVKRFQKGLRHHGKNFFQIRKELLPTKETGELVEFYYLSKKTQDSLMIRSNHRKQRRQAAMKKPEGKQKTTSYGSGDHTSTEEDTESEESEKEVNTKCSHCQKLTVEDLKIGGKESVKLCLDCRLFFKKYGENRPVVSVDEVESTNETDMDVSPAPKSNIPPFLFKPIKEEKVPVNVLLPKKPTKSVAKVKPTTEIKKPTKREWPDDVKTEPVIGATSKRPKSEPEEVPNEEQQSADQHHKTFIRNQTAETTDDDAVKESQSFPLSRQSLHPRIIPQENGNYFEPLAASEMNTGITSEIPTCFSTAKMSDTYMPSIGPFVPATQASQRLSYKPSELEAISKIAMSPGSIPGSRYSTVAYTGTTPSQGLAPSRGHGTNSPPCSTTVITTNGVRSTAVIEQPNPNMEGPPQRNNEPARSSKDATNLRTENPNENQHEKSKYKVPEFREPYPGASTHRGFPFDPRVTDQIISNANMARPPIKEEARSASPQQREAPRRGASHMSYMREPQVLRAVKQENYPYHPSTNPPRPSPMGALPQQQSSKSTMYQFQNSSHPPNHRSSPEWPHQSTVPMPYSRPLQEQDDSDVELIRETRPPTPTVPVEIPCSYGHSARFIKTLDRGSNSCFRTDFIFAVDEASRRRRQERQREEMKKQQEQKEANENAKAPPQKRPLTPPPPNNRMERRPEKVEPRERLKPDTGLPPQPGPSVYRSTPGHLNVTRNTPTTTPATAFDPQHHRPTPGAFVSPVGATFGPDMPALRHLQQIASIDFQRHAAMVEAAGIPPGPAHSLYRYYQLMGIDPEAAERELRERDRLAKLGDLKPHEMINPNIPQLHPNALVAGGFHVGGLPGQPMPSMEQLHQYQAQLLHSLPPGAHPHSALAANMSHGAIAAAQLEAAYTADRISFERMQAERLAAEQQLQLELLHHHSHSHVHSHLHLHGPSQGGGPPPAGTPLPLPALPPPGPALAVADPLLNPYAAVQAMGPLVSGANPLLTQSMIRSHQAAAQAALMQQGLAAPHLSAATALAVREQAAAAQQHPFTQHLQAVNEQHVMESQHRARAVAAMQEQQYLHARFKP